MPAPSPLPLPADPRHGDWTLPSEETALPPWAEAAPDPRRLPSGWWILPAALVGLVAWTAAIAAAAGLWTG